MSTTADQIIAKAYLHAQRKATPPASGTPKYNALLGIVDSVQKMWADEPDIDWNDLYTRRVLAAAAGAGDTFALDADIERLAHREDDPVTIGNITFRIVNPNQLYKYQNEDMVAIMGGNLTFSHALDSSLYGLPIEVPAILTVPDITSGSQTIMVPKPMWMVYMVAAEFDRNDIVKVAQYGNLINMANQVMERMKNNNSGSFDEVDTPWMPEGMSWV